MIKEQLRKVALYFQRLELLKLKTSYTHTKQQKEGPVSAATIQAIQNSIGNRWPLYMFYIGDAEHVPGYRWVEPYTYGLSKFTNNQLLRAYQYKGVSTGITEGFKTFRLDRIRNTAPLTSKHFDTPRPLWSGGGDLLMSSVFLDVTFPGY